MRIHHAMAVVTLICGALGGGGPAYAAVIGVDNAKSGRIQVFAAEGDFGSALPGSPFFSPDVALVGDNPPNDNFLGIWAYDVTAVFATDYNSGGSVGLDFSTFAINNGGGSAGDLELFLLQVSTKSDPLDVADDSGAGQVLSLGSVPGTVANTAYNIDITSQLDTNTGGSLSLGDTIWIGVDGGYSSNGAANNLFVGGPGGGSLNSTLTSEAIPEPASLVLLGLGGSLLARRRRRTVFRL